MSDRPPFPLALPQSCGTLHLPASLLWFFAGYSVPDYGEAGTFFIMLTLQPSFRPFNERSGLFSPLFLSPTRYAHGSRLCFLVATHKQTSEAFKTVRLSSRRSLGGLGGFLCTSFTAP